MAYFFGPVGPELGLAVKSVASAISQTSKLLSTWGVWGNRGAEKILETVPKHELYSLSSENVIRLADEIGLETPRDQLILWSGLGQGREGIKLSQEFAHANGGITLEMTPGGKWLDQMDLFGSNSPFTRLEANKIWRNVSTRMIQQASGQARAVIGQVRPSSVYRAEQAEILMNNKILGLDELHLKPRYIFGK